jgi:isopentenyldiphosphate isomerase
MPEYLDIVDPNDHVIGKAERKEIYRKHLCHRIAHVMIFNDEGKMALQLRSENCSFCPNHWSTTVGGHVQAGETYEEGARREYEEELGTVSDLERVGKDFYDQSDLHKFLTTFKTTFNGPFRPDPEAVQRVDFFTIDEIRDMIDQGDPFHPELLFLLNRYYL